MVGDEVWLSPGEETEGPADQTSSEPASGIPGEDKRESTGLSEPQE